MGYLCSSFPHQLPFFHEYLMKELNYFHPHQIHQSVLNLSCGFSGKAVFNGDRILNSSSTSPFLCLPLPAFPPSSSLALPPRLSAVFCQERGYGDQSCHG